MVNGSLKKHGNYCDFGYRSFDSDSERKLILRWIVASLQARLAGPTARKTAHSLCRLAAHHVYPTAVGSSRGLTPMPFGWAVREEGRGAENAEDLSECSRLLARSRSLRPLRLSSRRLRPIRPALGLDRQIAVLPVFPSTVNLSVPRGFVGGSKESLEGWAITRGDERRSARYVVGAFPVQRRNARRKFEGSP